MRKIFPHIILFGILCIAAFMRLYRIDEYLTFLGDEGRDALVVYGILHGDLTLLGPTMSVGGFFLGPAYYYFMAPFLWLFNYSPVGPAVMVAIFSITTTFFIYKVGSEFFGKSAGLVAASLFAISPLVIGYSRSSWNPNLMPFFSLSIMYLLYKAFLHEKKTLLFIVGILYGIAMQLHYVEIFLGVGIIAYVVLMRSVFLKKAQVLTAVLRDGVLLLGGFLLGWSPFIAFELRHGFPNAQAIAKFIFASPEVSTGGNFFSIVGDLFFRLFGRLITKFPPPDQIAAGLHGDVTFWMLATIVLAVSATGLLLFQLKSSWKVKDKLFRQRALLAVWLVFGLLFFGFYKKPIYDYYLQMVFPIPFLLTGNLLITLSQRNMLAKLLATVIFISLVAINLAGIPFRYEPNRQMAQMKEIAEFTLSKTDGKPFNFALITPGNSDHAYRYFFKLNGRDPIVIQNHEIDPDRKSVTKQLLIICEDTKCEPLGNSLWEVAGYGRAEIAEQWDVSVVKVYKLVPYSEEPGSK